MIPKIKPPKGKQYRVKQSRFKALDGTNVCRALVYGSSGAGKDVWMTAFLTDSMRGCYERIYYFSPSCDIDSQMIPLQSYVTDVLHVPPSEKWYYSEWEPDVMFEIMEAQKTKIMQLKKEDVTLLPQICVVINDWADRQEITHAPTNNPITTAYLKGRHWAQSTIICTQRYASVATSIRVNCTHMCLLKSAPTQSIKLFCEEFGNLAGGADNLMKIHEYAIAEPWSFLWCDFTATDNKNVFMLRFERYLTIDNIA
jgi:hypothetical protein